VGGRISFNGVIRRDLMEKAILKKRIMREVSKLEEHTLRKIGTLKTPVGGLTRVSALVNL